MEEEHEVPILQIEPQVNLPVINIPVPRRLAVFFGGFLIIILTLWGQGVNGQILFTWILPASLLLSWAYWYFRPEKLTFDRWVVVLWEYTGLPHHVIWEATHHEPPAEEDQAGPTADFLEARP